ncbi:MAG TPA: glycosyltransferase [Candidatus Gastranaerophilales bacterium]|nr:glycosyltransferase [Candidatus Gastranaerophilales bacterium]
MKEPKRILYINNFFTKYGGAENTIQKISSLMANKGHEVFYFSTDKKPYFKENYEYSKYFTEFSDKRKLSFDKPENFMKTFYNFEAKRNLKTYLNEIKPDLVSIHNIHFHLTPSVIDACEELKIPMVFYFHDPRSFCPGGTLSYRGQYCHKKHCITGNPLMCLVNKCKLDSFKGSLIASIYYLYFRSLNIFNKAAAIICPSQAMLNLALSAGVKKDKLYHINHFIEDELLQTESGNDNQDYFLYVGRLDREKGVDLLIEAMRKLPKDVLLHIVGEGYEKEKLINLAKSYNLDNINFLGYLDGEDLKIQYQNCLATILPCNWFEVFGRTLLESFLCSKPVIASNIAAIPNIIDHGLNGYLFEPKNIEEISEMMLRLINDKEFAAEMGENGNKKLKLLYNSELYYSKYLELLIKILN